MGDVTENTRNRLGIWLDPRVTGLSHFSACFFSVFHFRGISPHSNSQWGQIATRSPGPFYQLHDSQKLGQLWSFLPGSSIKSPRAHPDWTPLDHVPLTEPITVAEGWRDGVLIGQVCLITVQVLPRPLKWIFILKWINSSHGSLFLIYWTPGGYKCLPADMFLLLLFLSLQEP